MLERVQTVPRGGRGEFWLPCRLCSGFSAAALASAECVVCTFHPAAATAAFRSRGDPPGEAPGSITCLLLVTHPGPLQVYTPSHHSSCPFGLAHPWVCPPTPGHACAPPSPDAWASPMTTEGLETGSRLPGLLYALACWTFPSASWDFCTRKMAGTGLQGLGPCVSPVQAASGEEGQGSG